MMRVLATAAIAALAVSSGLFALDSPGNEPSHDSREFELENVRVADAMIVLRSVAGIRMLKPSGEGSVLVAGKIKDLEVAGRVIQMIDRPEPDDDGFQPRGVPFDDSVIAALKLKHIKAPDVMEALRILKINTVTPCCNDELVVIRDLPDQVDAARKLVQVLERVAADQGEPAGIPAVTANTPAPTP